MSENEREDYSEGYEALRYLIHSTIVITLIAMAAATAGALIVRIARWALGW